MKVTSLNAAPAAGPGRESALARGIGWSLAGLVIAALLPIVAFAVWAAQSTIALKRAAVQAELTASARGLQVAVDRTLSSQWAAMHVLALDLAGDRVDRAAFEAQARRLVEANPDWWGAALIDPASRRIVAGAAAQVQPHELAASPADVEAVVRSRQPLATVVPAGGAAGAVPFVRLLSPVVRGGAVLVVLAVASPPAAFSKVFAAQRVPDSWTGAVIDGPLRLVGRSRDAEQFVGRAATDTLAARVRAGDSGMFAARTQEGGLVYTVFSRSPESGWTVALGVPADEVEAPIQAAVRQIASYALALGAAALLVAVAVGRGIVRRRVAARQLLMDELDERRRIEADLRASQERLRDYSASSADWFWETDAERRITDVSDAFTTMFGRPRSQIIGKSRIEMLATEGLNPPEVDERHLQVLARREPFRDFEYRLRDGTGQVRWVSVSGVPVFDADGTFRGYRGAGQDVTDRHAAEAALRDGHRLLREAVESVSGGFTIYDPEDRLFICNATYLDLYATSRDLIVPGARFEDIVRQGALRGQYPEAAMDIEGWVAQRVRQHQQPTGQPIEQALNDGRWLLIVESRTPSGYIVGNRLDITDLKRAEAQVRKLSLAVEQTASSVCITDLEGTIEYVNEAFVRDMGYSREEILGRNPRVLKSPLTPLAAFQSLREALARGQTWKGEFHNRRKDGVVRVDAAIVSPLQQSDGRVTHYVGILEDITDHKAQAEELQRYRDELEQRVAVRTAQLAEALDAAQAASRAKSGFLANMSHEIRTPLNAILGLSHLLRKALVDPAQAARLDMIEGAGRHLLDMLSAILDLSKIEAGKFVLEHQALDVEDLVRRAVALVDEEASKKGLTIAVDMSPLPSLAGDATRLRQALLNLLSNAVKFTESGSVQVAVRPLDVDGSHVLLRFEVRDTGIGVPPDLQPGLFSAFQQADNSMTRRHGGSGLGLAITRRFAELMGGEVGLSSRLGEGSLFWFTARLRRTVPDADGHRGGDMSPPATDARVDSDLAGGTVLLVDDNPINRDVGIELLTSMGLHVTVAEDGLEAVERAAAGGHDLILMDMQMPRLGGLEAARRIRALPGLAQVPILALTANAFVDDRQQCLDAGMNDFIAKPVHAEALAVVLRRWLRPAGPGGRARTAEPG